MQNKLLKINDKEFWAHESKLGDKSLVYIKGEFGYIMCGYLNKEAADSFGDLAAVVSGVSTVEDLLEKNLIWVSERARKLGLSIGMSVRAALEII